MNKYHKILEKVLKKGKIQENKKGNITFLLNEKLELKPVDLLEIFEGHGIARNKLKTELDLFQSGERFVNSYPTYFEQLPDLIKKINREKRNSKNYVLFLGKNDTESNQQPCLSLIQFQIDKGKLVLSAYQRSSDANLGLPADLYHLYLISRQINLPLRSITLFIGNVHIYDNNKDLTGKLLSGESVRFSLNV
ncbi:thymidylate synthase [Epilithonimonas xixisoli]|uniref:Thymidylate synthase n=1 Tax=Epilithonimonas xixisoli TaxID=1476462 RepID=A0A4R8I823_9FLAO|nr:thymidylate synthase [Epilithonimonas xixisoli]TDX86162.1 thymidylate synthase [Epilithonimonas xixisoli]